MKLNDLAFANPENVVLYFWDLELCCCNLRIKDVSVSPEEILDFGLFGLFRVQFLRRS